MAGKSDTVTEGGEDAFTVSVPPNAAPAAAAGDAGGFVSKLQELLSQLESVPGEQAGEVDPSMQGVARSLRMPGASTATNQQIFDWASTVAGQLGLV